MVRCKFRCHYKEGASIKMSPVYSGSEENKVFFQATPAGSIEFWSTSKAAADQIEVGKEYYVDIFPAE